jgi:hypothetical protein
MTKLPDLQMMLTLRFNEDSILEISEHPLHDQRTIKFRTLAELAEHLSHLEDHLYGRKNLETAIKN